MGNPKSGSDKFAKSKLERRKKYELALAKFISFGGDALGNTLGIGFGIQSIRVLADIFQKKNKSRNNSREPDCVKWLFDRCRSRVGTRQTDCAKKCRQTVTAYVEDLRHFITQQRKI
jgi:hypothetical protein